MEDYRECHGLPSRQFSACCALPFSTQGQARDRQTNGRTDNGHHCIMPTLSGGWHSNALKCVRCWDMEWRRSDAAAADWLSSVWRGADDVDVDASRLSMLYDSARRDSDVTTASSVPSTPLSGGSPRRKPLPHDPASHSASIFIGDSISTSRTAGTQFKNSLVCPVKTSRFYTSKLTVPRY